MFIKTDQSLDYIPGNPITLTNLVIENGIDETYISATVSFVADLVKLEGDGVNFVRRHSDVLLNTYDDVIQETQTTGKQVGYILKKYEKVIINYGSVNNEPALNSETESLFIDKGSYVITRYIKQIGRPKQFGYLQTMEFYIEDISVVGKTITLKLMDPIKYYLKNLIIQPQTFQNTTLDLVLRTVFTTPKDFTTLSWNSNISELNIKTEMTGLSFIALLKQLYSDNITISVTNGEQTTTNKANGKYSYQVFQPYVLRIGWRFWTENLEPTTVIWWNDIKDNKVDQFILKKYHKFHYPFRENYNPVLSYNNERKLGKDLQVKISTAIVDKKPTDKTKVSTYPTTLKSYDQYIIINYPWEMDQAGLDVVTKNIYMKNMGENVKQSIYTMSYDKFELGDEVDFYNDTEVIDIVDYEFDNNLTTNIEKYFVSAYKVEMNIEGYRKTLTLEPKINF